VLFQATARKGHGLQILAAFEKLCPSIIGIGMNQWYKVDLAFDSHMEQISAMPLLCSTNTLVTSSEDMNTVQSPVAHGLIYVEIHEKYKHNMAKVCVGIRV